VSPPGGRVGEKGGNKYPEGGFLKSRIFKNTIMIAIEKPIQIDLTLIIFFNHTLIENF